MKDQHKPGSIDWYLETQQYMMKLAEKYKAEEEPIAQINMTPKEKIYTIYDMWQAFIIGCLFVNMMWGIVILTIELNS